MKKNGVAVMSMSSMRPVWLLWTALAAVLVLYMDQVAWLWNAWLQKEEYSHGLLMPLVVAFILWERRRILQALEMRPSWFGVVVLVFSLLVFLGGSLAHLEVVKNYALILSLAGVLIAYGGRPLFKETWFPLLLMFLVIPLPNLMNAMLTAELQLLSSQIGVWVIRLAGIPVFLEGNVIDLGTYKLLVVEACSGLRYLYPLISLAFIIAYFYRGPLWHKVLLVVSAIPLTIFTNSFRIGVTGILVEHFGTGIAEGFLHDFEGWIVFLFASALLLLEIKLLLVLTRSGVGLSDAFGMEVPEVDDDAKALGKAEYSGSLGPILSALLAVGAAAAASTLYLHGDPISPDRATFDEFPLQVGDWRGQREPMPPLAMDVLMADDYFIGDYRSPEGKTLELYMVYYLRQQDGAALHSPKVCIPGGGWEIDRSSFVVVDTPQGPLNAVRMIIGHGVHKQLLYYWIQQQGRTFANEHVARASLIRSAVSSRRTDGALVRLSILIDGDDEAAADAVLHGFIREMVAELPRVIPD